MQIRINKAVFTLDDRYAAGHVLTEQEAQQLNRVRAENIANNFRAEVNKFFEENKEAATVPTEIVTKFGEYATSYEFAQRAARGVGTSRATDPVEREALNIIIGLIRNQLTAAGKNVRDYAADAIRAKAQTVLDSEKGEGYRAKAREVLAARQSVALELDLDGIEPAPASEEPAAESKPKRGKKAEAA